jgi:branched-chain amino acid transport system ATP-binding protein
VSDATLLALRGVRAAVGSFQILQGIDFTVTEGRTTVVLGRNGVGKTTTLRTIMGYVRDTQGSIRYRGEELRGQPPHRVARRGIAYVPEDRGIFGQLTVGENLRLAAPDTAAWEPGLELFPALRERLKDRAGALSGGQQQMLTVARALAQSPDLLLLDEPTKGLAPRVIEEMVDALEQLRERSTVLVVEQNLEAARRLAQDVVVIDDGLTVAYGSLAQLEREGDIERFLTVTMATPAREEG